MKILRIENYIKQDGSCDYKGLNINQFIGGTQIYLNDEICYVKTDQDDFENHPEIMEVTDEMYQNEYSKLKTADNSPSIQRQMELIQSALDEILLGCF